MNDMPDGLDEIVQEVAARHGIVLGRDDPILMIYTINGKVMEASTGIQRALLEEYLAGMKTLSAQFQEQSASRFDTIMREATTSARLALRQEVQQLFREHKLESETANRKMVEDFLHWRRFAGLSACISVLTLAAAAAVLWVG